MVKFRSHVQTGTRGDFHTMEALQLLEVIYTAPSDSSAPVTVHRGQLGSRPVAVKKQLHPDLQSINLALNEALLQAKCATTGVCEIITISLDRTSQGMETTLVMEWGLKDLYTEIGERRKENRFWTEDELLGHLSDLVETLASMQSHGITHRDIKPPNMLVTSNGRIKLADFGSSKQIDGETAQTILGTLNYLSPEVNQIYRNMMRGAQNRESYDPFKSDMYSLGVTTLHMCFLRHPSKAFVQTSVEDILERLPETYARIKRIVKWMLEQDPTRRPNFLDLHSRFVAVKDRKARIEKKCVCCDVNNLAEKASPAIVLECNGLHYFHNQDCLQGFLLRATKCFSQDTQLRCPECSELISTQFVHSAFGGTEGFEVFKQIGRQYCGFCYYPEASKLPCGHFICHRCLTRFSKPDRDVCPLDSQFFPYPCSTCQGRPQIILECGHLVCQQCSKPMRGKYLCQFDEEYQDQVRM